MTPFVADCKTQFQLPQERGLESGGAPQGWEGQGLHYGLLLAPNKIGPTQSLTILAQDLLKDLCKLYNRTRRNQGDPPGATGAFLGQGTIVWAMELVTGLDQIFVLPEEDRLRVCVCVNA